MLRDFDVSMSTMCSKLKVSQMSVLRQMLLQSVKVSLSESIAGIAMVRIAILRKFALPAVQLREGRLLEPRESP